MLFDFIDIVGIMLDIMIAYSLFAIIAQQREVALWVKILAIGCAVVIRSAVTLNSQEQLLMTIVFFVVYLLLSRLFKVKVIKSALMSILLIILLILSEIIIGLILTALSSMTVEQVTENVFYYIQGALMSRLIVFVIVKAFGYFSTPSEMRVSNRFFMALMLHPFATFLVIYVMSKYMYEASEGAFLKLSAIAVIILIFSNIMLFYLFEHYIKINEEKTEQQLIKQDLEYKAEYYRELCSKQKITNKTMHDLKNQLFALKESLQNNVGQGIAKVNELCDDVLLSNPIAFTGNEAIDALISVKKDRMQQRNINFDHYIYMASDNNINVFDMCVILGNLFDNAIEASEKVDIEDRFIVLNMKQSLDYISIQVSNVVNEEVIICNNKILTTKKDKERHGFGIKSVEEIVKKYNGSLLFRQEKNIFTAVLMLQNN